MKFENTTGTAQKIRSEKEGMGYEWSTCKPGETIDIEPGYGRRLEFTQVLEGPAVTPGPAVRDFDSLGFAPDFEISLLKKSKSKLEVYANEEYAVNLNGSRTKPEMVQDFFDAVKEKNEETDQAANPEEPEE